MVVHCCSNRSTTGVVIFLLSSLVLILSPPPPVVAAWSWSFRQHRNDFVCVPKRRTVHGGVGGGSVDKNIRAGRFIMHGTSPPSTSSDDCRGSKTTSTRRGFVCGIIASGITTTATAALADGQGDGAAAVQLTAPGDAGRLFNEARALESQGNVAAAQRIYTKVTQLAPRFVYGWSQLGNTQTVFGDLKAAEQSYDTAIDLCNENIKVVEAAGLGGKKCSDLYVLLLNRGAIKLNAGGNPKEALEDLERSALLRGRPDAVVLQNLARAREANGMYAQADRDYSTAVAMTANEVSPFWIRSANVKFQLGDVKGGFDLLKRVENRFPDAPEVRAAYATYLAAQGEQTKAQQKFLEIPDRQRLKFVDKEYLTKTIAWPPAMIDTLAKVTAAVGDRSS